MNILCELVNIDCLPCNDDPIRNISAEDPDRDVFIGFQDLRLVPPLGVLYAQVGCKRICFSDVSQRDADDCAIRQAQECTWRTWRPVPQPPTPPGPDGKPPPGTPGNPGTPGGIPPSNPRNNRLPTFRNRLQTCTVFCPDGTPFVEEVAAGVVAGLSQVAADQIAKSLACKRANVDRLCITSDLLPGGCVGIDYSFTFQGNGGLTFSDGGYIWNLFGDLPPGLQLDGGSGIVSGTPTVNGNYLFDIQVTDANGNSTTGVFQLCVMEIVTDEVLPPATAGDDYTQPLLEEPGEVSSETWTLISGSLPAGLTLNAAGSITGTPEELDDPDENEFNFTIQCVATCGTGQVTCSKSFILLVESVDCMGHPAAVEDLPAWAETIGGTFTMVGGDGTFSASFPGPIGNIFVEATTPFLCNPHLDNYDITIEFNWTVAGANAGIIDSQASFFMNGVNYNGTLFPGNGARSQTHVATLNSGVNTNLRLYVVYGGLTLGPGPATINGTVTIRPLTPP